MNDRIKEIRREVGLTQEGFAARLNLTRNFIAQVEMGTKEPSDRTIRDICREFGYREEWLRSGDGDPKPASDRAKEIRARVEKLFADDSAEFQQALISALLQFEPDGPQWQVVEEIFESVRAKMPAAPVPDPNAPADLDSKPALHAELDRQIDLEKGDADKSEASLSTG